MQKYTIYKHKKDINKNINVYISIYLSISSNQIYSILFYSIYLST